METLARLGIDWKLLVAQIINFCILLLILRRFAYRPLLDMLEQRTARIEQGLQDAEASRARLLEAEEKEKEILNQAKEESKRILERAEEAAKKHQDKIFEDTQLETARLISLTKKKMDAERIRLVAEARAELSEVVIAAVEGILREKLDSERDSELIRKSLAETRLEK